MDKIEILKELKSMLNKELTINHVDQMILFGSRVTGGAHDYSDYDVLITLQNDYDWRLRNKISEICFEIGLEYDILIDSKVISQNEMKSIRGRQPFILDALDHGIVV